MPKTLLLTVLLTGIGCIDIDYNTSIVNNMATPEGGLLGDGAPCNGDHECVHNTCMHSMNEFGYGICFSVEWIGCVAITEPVPLVPICDNARDPYVCGNYDATLTGRCDVVGVGDLGELYYCCDKL
jgi:hypothetical protein